MNWSVFFSFIGIAVIMLVFAIGSGLIMHSLIGFLTGALGLSKIATAFIILMFFIVMGAAGFAVALNDRR